MRPVALGALVLSLALGCGRKTVSTLATPLPESQEAPGWSKTGPTRAFEASSLWQYINGDAEKYLRAGVRRTLTADYRYQDGTEAVVDVHEMAGREGAAKILEAEPAAGSRALALGDAARLYGASLVFRQGRYVVRLVAYRDTPEARSGLVSLARAVQARLGRPPTK